MPPRATLAFRENAKIRLQQRILNFSCKVSSRGHGRKRLSKLTRECRISSMSYRPVPRKSTVAKAFTTFQARTIGEFRGGNLLASIQFDGSKAQNGCVAAADLQFIFFEEDSSWCGLSFFIEPGFTPEVAGL